MYEYARQYLALLEIYEATVTLILLESVINTIANFLGRGMTDSRVCLVHL